MDAFNTGAHVIVEKPATPAFEELETLAHLVSFAPMQGWRATRGG